MATAFRDWPWPLQALFYLALTVVIIAAGFYIPGLPLASVRETGETFGAGGSEPASLQTT